MNLGIKNLLDTLSKKTDTFCIIRGHKNLFNNDFRDIDCFVRADEFHIIDYELTDLGFLKKGFRPSAVFYEKHLNGVKCIIDLHIDFSIHGVDWNLNFDVQKHCQEILGVRTLNEQAALEHAILISVFQNKGLNVNIKYLPKYSELTFIRPEKREYVKAIQFLQSSKKFRKLKFFIYLFKCRKRTIFDWHLVFSHENLNCEAIVDYGQLGIGDLFQHYNMGSVRRLFIKLTEKKELRFAWSYGNNNKVMQFISQHSLRARIRKNIAIAAPWLIKANFYLPVYNKKRISSFKREFLSIFFGTPSKARSLIFCYKKNERTYYIKSKPERVDSVYSAKHEYDSIYFFGKVQSAFKVPQVKLFKSKLVAREVTRSKPFNKNIIRDHLISLTKDQLVKSQSIRLEEFLDSLSVEYAKQNEQAYILYRKLLDMMRRRFLNEEATIITSWAHCDVTPWNIISTPQKLTLIDFEKFRYEGFPVGYDFVHYYFSVLVFSNTNNKKRLYKKTLATLDRQWKLLGILDRKLLYLNCCLVVIEYLAVAASSEKTLSQYNNLYTVANFVLNDDYAVFFNAENGFLIKDSVTK